MVLSEQLISLQAKQVHYYCIDLSKINVNAVEMKSWLSVAEMKRLHAFHQKKSANYFCSARGILRELIGQYFQAEPNEILFCYNENGKPYLDESISSKFQFNVSHTGNHLAIVFSWDKRVGVDIENNKNVRDFPGLAKRFFSPHEADLLDQIKEDQQQQAFYNAWTRKEAFIKALGRTVPSALKDFAVSLKPGNRAELLWMYVKGESQANWFFEEINCADDITAVICIEGSSISGLTLVKKEYPS